MFGATAMSNPIENPGKTMFVALMIGSAGVAAAFCYGLKHGEPEEPEVQQLVTPQAQQQLKRKRTIVFQRTWPDGRKESLFDRREEV